MNTRGWVRGFRLAAAAVAGMGAIAAAHAAVFAQTDASVGTWRLNLAKSSFSPGPGPKSSTVTIEAIDNGIKVTAKGVDAKGNPTTTSYTATYDGQDYPVTMTGGAQDFDAIALKRLDPRKVDGVRKKGGRVVQTYSRVVSKDGDTMTITATGTNAAGQRVIHVAVYDKQVRR